MLAIEGKKLTDIHVKKIVVTGGASKTAQNLLSSLLWYWLLDSAVPEIINCHS